METEKLLCSVATRDLLSYCPVPQVALSTGQACTGTPWAPCRRQSDRIRASPEAGSQVSHGWGVERRTVDTGKYSSCPRGFWKLTVGPVASMVNSQSDKMTGPRS